MKTKFTIEIEGSREEIDEFTRGVNKFVHRNRQVLLDVKPMGGYVPRFYLPRRKKKGFP